MSRRAAPRLMALAVTLASLAGSCVAPPVQSVEAAPPATAVRQAPPPFDPPPAGSTPPFISASDGVVVWGKPPEQGGVLLGRMVAGAANLTLDGQPVRVAADGRFLIAFGRDAAALSELRVTMPNAGSGRIVLDVMKRNWPTETIDGLPRFAQPSADYAARRPAELALINAARRTDLPSDGWRQAFVWPVRGRISGRFGSQRVYANGERGDPHSGVDVARPTGTLIVAPADGVVVLAADAFTLEGNMVLVDHGMGLTSAFLHLSRIDVLVGDRVRQGQSLGAIGATGRASGSHLHWGMKWLDRRIDPGRLAGPMPVK